MRLSLRPSSIPPSATEIFEAVKGLRSELETATDVELRALLLHEVGVLEELHRDDHAAAKDLLGAVNSATALREPLEQLIALVERRHSFQNLGKLLDRLGRVVTEPEEVARAQLARGDFLTDHRNDDEAARQAYEIAEQSGVLLSAIWLSLEWLAHKLGDRELARRTLSARARSAQTPAYKAWLQVRAARAALAAGEEQNATETLAAVAADNGPGTDLALAALEEHAQGAGERRRVAELREARAQLLSLTVEDPENSPYQGLEPHSAAAMATELWIRAAHDRRHLGDTDRALAALARAERLLANNPAVQFALVDAHGDARNWVGVSQAISALLKLHNLKGSGKAALLTRAAEAEAHRQRPDEALLLLRQALEADPECLSARALQLHLISIDGKLEDAAEALEGFAENYGEGPTRARYLARAALGWSQTKGQTQAARAALLRAAEAGTPPVVVARWARLLSGLCADPHWQREAAERLLKTADVEERHSVRLQLSADAWLRGDGESARETLRQLSKTPEGAWLGAILRAYQPTTADSELPADAKDDGIEALAALAAVSPPEHARALLQVVALRRHESGQITRAREVLAGLHDEHPADVAVVAQLAHVLRQDDAGLDAAQALTESGDAIADPEVAAALKLLAGILAWQAGERTQAVANLESASELNATASSGLLHWALRAAEPDSPGARLKAMRVALESNGDADVYALERFALGLGSAKTQPSKATEGLDEADDVSLGESGDAVQLARALWPHSEEHTAALRHLEAQSAPGREIAHGLRFHEERSRTKPDPQKLTQLASAWANSGSVAGALEWYATALANKDARAECAAREALTSHLNGDAELAMQAGNALVSFVALDEAPPLLDSAAPSAVLANLETSPPGCDPRRRALALAGEHTLVDEEGQAVNLALAGYNELLSQRPDAALASFRVVVKTLPQDIFGWEGIRLAAQQLEKRDIEASACRRLGELSHDPLVAARYFREAATLLGSDLGDEASAREVLRHAVELDISHKSAFYRWYAVVKEKKDDATIVELLARRIAVSNDAAELVSLYWDRACAYRRLEQLDAALEELANLHLLDQAHVGARALKGEIYIRQQQFALAATELAELATMSSAPEEQRLMSGVAAVDLYEDKLNDIPKALDVLDTLQQAGLETLAVRERLARATAKAKRWEDATRLLEELLVQRETSTGKVDAARLLMAIYRDELQDAERAEVACETLLREAPTDAEGIDFVLDGSFAEGPTERLLERIRRALLRAPVSDLDDEQLARTARVAEQLDDLSLRQAALGALITVGINDQDMRRELAELDQRSQRHPQISLSQEQVSQLLDPADSGLFAQLFATIGPYLPEVLGPTLKTLDVGRRQRLKPPAGSELRAEIAAFTGAFGLGDFELYQGGLEPNALLVVPSPKAPAFVVGPNVGLPFDISERWLVAQQVLGLQRGTSVLLQRDVTEGAALAAAACAVGKHPLSGPSFAMLGEFTRALDRGLPRKVRKELAEIARELQAAQADPREYVKAARSSLDRIAAVAIGDVSWLLLSRSERQTQSRNFDANTEERVWSLIRFVLSTEFAELRQQLGMAPR